ncbi:MAG: hypothetical protein DRI61_15565 [Chloroflexi bacterium]|nr:MAG: hypothetical protein DRI61_15565 [Chloroflexota bacterium]
MTRKDFKNSRWKYTPLGFLAIGIVAGIVVLSGISFQDGSDGKSWKIMTLSAADVDPGNGNDGIVNIYIYPLSEKADITSSPYEPNEADAYEHCDSAFVDGEELEDSTPVGSTYIIAIEVQFSNKAYNTTSSDWDKDLVKAEITCAELSLTAEVMEEAPDFSQQDGTSDAHMTFYVDNSDSGWTMTTGNSITVSDVDIYYYG